MIFHDSFEKKGRNIKLSLEKYHKPNKKGVVVVRRPSIVVVVRLPRNPPQANTIRKFHKEFVCGSGICKLHKKLSPVLWKIHFLKMETSIISYFIFHIRYFIFVPYLGVGGTSRKDSTILKRFMRIRPARSKLRNLNDSTANDLSAAEELICFSCVIEGKATCDGTFDVNMLPPNGMVKAPPPN